MSSDETGKRLQEYLDGRLSEAERSAFEARLADDPALARHVEAAREIRRALRDEAATLSPGFYARARARFEERAPGGGGRRWFRPLSWETAGLAAAVLLVAVVFLPFRDELAPPEALREAPSADSAEPSRLADRPDVDADSKGVASELRHQPAASGVDDALKERTDEARQKKLSPAPAPAPAPAEGHFEEETASESPGRLAAVAPPEEEREPVGKRKPGQRLIENEPLAERNEKETPTPALPLAAPEAAGEAEPRRQVAEAAESADAFSPVPPAEAGADRDRMSEAAPETKRAREPLARYDQAPDYRFHAAATATYELDADAIEPGAWRQAPFDGEWRRHVVSPAGPAGRIDARGFAVVETDAVRTRALLVGARPGLSACEDLRIEARADAYVIRVESSDRRRAGTVGGCAVVLPDDEREIRFESER